MSQKLNSDFLETADTTLLFLKEQFPEKHTGELHCLQIAIVGQFFCLSCYSFWWFFDVANKLNSFWKINYKLEVFWAVHTVFVSSSSICSKCITGTDTKKEGVFQLSPQSGFWTGVLLPDSECSCIKKNWQHLISYWWPILTKDQIEVSETFLMLAFLHTNVFVLKKEATFYVINVSKVFFYFIFNQQKQNTCHPNFVTFTYINLPSYNAVPQDGFGLPWALDYFSLSYKIL